MCVCDRERKHVDKIKAEKMARRNERNVPKLTQNKRTLCLSKSDDVNFSLTLRKRNVFSSSAQIFVNFDSQYLKQ